MKESAEPEPEPVKLTLEQAVENVSRYMDETAGAYTAF